jgi:hypothetical protein
MEKKFEIIEEGRLDKSKMNALFGGTYVAAEACPTIGASNEYGSDICLKDGTLYSFCPENYGSCTGDGFVKCPCNYSGPTGPDGITTIK